MRSIILFAFLVAVGVVVTGCGAQKAATSSDTPTAAYKRLFEAVKSKNTEAIKQTLSKKTFALAEFTAQKYKKTIDQALENGFTATTFADSLPTMRDERVKDDMGALEVWNSRDNRWEDLPFVFEDGNWKFAVGDAFANTWKSPGKGQAQIEMEAANKLTANGKVINRPSSNANPKDIVRPKMPAGQPIPTVPPK